MLRSIKNDFDAFNSALTLTDRRLVYDSFSAQVQMKFATESKRLYGEDVEANRLGADALREKIRASEQKRLGELNECGVANHLYFDCPCHWVVVVQCSSTVQY